MGRKWTEEEVKELKLLFNKGVSDEEIGIKFGRTTPSIGVKRFKLGITDSHKRRYTKQGKQKIIETAKKRTGEKGSSWKGGKRVTSNGYIELHLPDHHRSRGNGYVFEHIVIVEMKIGRELQPGEEVHHVNKNKQDNRPENLQVLSKEEHATLHGAEKEKTGKILNCMYCGKEFYSKPSHVSIRKTCSKSCAALNNGFPFSRKKEKCINE